jgi:hypothetical protein
MANYPKAIAWLTRYLGEGGDDERSRQLLTAAYYWNGDYARAAKDLQSEIQADDQNGRAPTEGQLQMLLSCESKLNDKAGYLLALEQMAAHYPKKEIWTEMLGRLASKPGFAENRLGLDVYRLKLAVGAVDTAEEYVNMAELALQANYPAEAKKVIDAAYKAGFFGTSGDSDRQKRLRDMADKNAIADQKALAQTEMEVGKSREGTGMVNVGYDYVISGQIDKGIGLMEEGIAKGNLKHPDDAKLHLALAYLQADKKANALQLLKTVQGTDGTAELAHYWLIANSYLPKQ